MNNISRQKSVQLNKAVKLISRSTSKTSNEHPIWMASATKTTPQDISDGRPNQRSKLLSNLPPKNMMSKRWCSTNDFAFDATSGANFNETASLSQAFDSLDIGSSGAGSKDTSSYWDVQKDKIEFNTSNNN